MSTSLESRVLGVLSGGGLTAEEIAAWLWPHWRTQRGHMTAAAVGTVRKMMRKLEASQQVTQAEKTRGGCTVFVSVPVDLPA